VSAVSSTASSWVVVASRSPVIDGTIRRPMSDQGGVSVPEDPTSTDPSLYKVVFENERVRVLEYRDRHGDRTHPHGHPDTVMVTLSSFRRRLHGDDGRQADVDLPAGQVRWVGAQTHAGENIGASESHCIFVELKEPPSAGARAGDPPLGPTT
jgi:beta-alanine degradation protein BauB